MAQLNVWLPKYTTSSRVLKLPKILSQGPHKKGVGAMIPTFSESNIFCRIYILIPKTDVTLAYPPPHFQSQCAVPVNYLWKKRTILKNLKSPKISGMFCCSPKFLLNFSLVEFLFSGYII